MTLNKTLNELLSNHRGRVKLALSMEVPIRCGGAHYENGVLIHMLGGKGYDPEQLEVFRQKIRDENRAKLEEIDRMTDEEFNLAYPDYHE